MGGCPVELITDLGTESGIAAASQCFFRANGDAHRYVQSPETKGIFFSDLEHRKVIDISLELYKECLWYCFHSVIQFDLDKFKEHWNVHIIRKSRYSNVAGKPDSLYFLPERYGGEENLLHDVPERKQNYIAENIVVKQKSNEYQECFEYISIQQNFAKPLGKKHSSFTVY
eukprot:gene10306-11370_t